MKRNAILKTIKDLSKSQGAYGRLLDTIKTLSKEDYNTFMLHLEAHNFSSPLDLIMYFEGGI